MADDIFVGLPLPLASECRRSDFLTPVSGPAPPRAPPLKSALKRSKPSSCATGPRVRSKRLGLRTTAAIIFARLTFVPLARLGIVNLADKFGFIPERDKMFKFVLLLQHFMPTSVLSGVVANLKGCGKESAAILYFEYIYLQYSPWLDRLFSS